MGWTKRQYEDRIRARLADLGVIQMVATLAVPFALEEALAVFIRDYPRVTSRTISGNGTTYTFDLTAVAGAPWLEGVSRLVDVEYPAGRRTREYVDARHIDERDGVVTLTDDTPLTGESVVIRFTTSWPNPTDDPDDDLIPEPFRIAVASKAAAILARTRALELARRRSTSVAGELIDHDPGPLFTAAAELESAYSRIVNGPTSSGGGGSSSRLAMVVGDVQPVFPRSLFHQRPITPQ